MMLCVCALVLSFKSSTDLAAAYGIAVTSTMVITAILAYVVAVERWHWSRSAALLVVGGFLLVDLAFFSSNLVKIAQGGWFPLAVAGGIFLLMTTWKRGREILQERVRRDSM